MNTLDELNRATTMPIFHNVPTGIGNRGFIIVSQEEIHYQTGNPNEVVLFEDCLEWEDLSKKANQCSYKCLPGSNF